MLDSISWPEFITEAITLLAIYYIVAFLLLYNKEISAKVKSIVSPGVQEYSPEALTNSDDLMGKAKSSVADSNNTPVTSEELKVYPDKDEVINEDTQSSILLGSVADLLQELTILTSAMAQYPKQEAVSMLQTLLSRYTHVCDSSYREAITSFIHNSCKENVGFDLSLNEINSLWQSQSNK